MSKFPKFWLVDDEIWAKYPDAKLERYEIYVSHLGKIKEIPKKRLFSLEKTIRDMPEKDVKGWTNKNRETVMIAGEAMHVSAIVCASFIGKCPNQTNHVHRINGNTSDCRLINLHWKPGENSTMEIELARQKAVVNYLKKEYGKYALL